MKHKKKIVLALLFGITLIGVIGNWLIGNPFVFSNNQKLANAEFSVTRENGIVSLMYVE